MPTGKPRKPAGDAELERKRENARRRYYGLEHIPKDKGPRPDPESQRLHELNNRRDRRQQIIRALGEYKLAKQCADCDRRFDVAYHLDFDHLPGAEKSFNLSKPGGRSWQVVMAEVDKCEVVCALCHRDRTVARRAGQPAKGGVSRGDTTPALPLWG